MAGTKEIKSHIESVRETRKITNAMYLIASTKLRRARQELDNTRPYFEALRREIKRIFRTVGGEVVDSPYFYPAEGETGHNGTYGCLVITADKGLAGSYNQNAIREAMKLLEQHPNTKLFVVGEYGRRFFSHRNIPIEHSFLYTAQNPTMARAREISALLRETYGGDIKVFDSEIPHSVRAKETSAEGKSIFAHDPGGKVAEAYGNLTREVLQLEKQRAKSRAGISL